MSRPDILFAVNHVSRFVNNFDENHWNAVKKIIKYLKGTKNYRVLCRRSEEDSFQLTGWSDSNYASDIDTRRSTTGYLFLLNQGPISWCSRRQQTVALSTTEAEYMAASAAVKESLWLRSLLMQRPIEPITINIDNQAALRLIKNPKFYKRTKHIDVFRFHFIREKFENGEINISYIHSSNQLADIMTKALPRNIFLKHEEVLLKTLD